MWGWEMDQHTHHDSLEDFYSMLYVFKSYC